MASAKQISRCVCAGLYVVAGVNHFVNTAFYLSIMPPFVPWQLASVYASGIAEIALGLFLMFSRTARVAAWGLIVLLIAVFPANVHMAVHPELYSWASPLGLWLRLPLQALLVAWAYWYTRAEPGTARESRSPRSVGSVVL